MELQKIVTLIERLSEKTTEGTVKWEESLFANSIYETQVGKHNIFVRERHEEEMSDPDYFLGFYNSAHEEIDSFSDRDLRDVMSSSYKIMRELYRAAKRQALGVNKMVDDVLNELDDDDIPF